MNNTAQAIVFGFTAALLSACALEPSEPSTVPWISQLIPEQAAYDARHYDLDISVDPSTKTISGTVTVRATVLAPLEYFVLDLGEALKVSSVQLMAEGQPQTLNFEHRIYNSEQQQTALGSPQHSQLWIALPRPYHADETLNIAVTYAGQPGDATASPPTFNGGFTWTTSQDGQPWITVSIGAGSDLADVWWPLKKHRSDEPEEGVSMHFTVPQSLQLVANGRFEGRENNYDGTATHHWRVTTPINTYNIVFNAGSYRKIQQPYRSVSGQTFPVTFWVLPENYEEGRALYPQLLQALNFFERYLGPYPFQGDKLAFVDTPYLGMEHQTVVAYGLEEGRNNYPQLIYNGWHMIPFHELGHEWWGNLVSAASGNDWMWLHEAFDSYMTALYFEDQYGQAAYHEAITRMGILNVGKGIVAQAEPMAAKDAIALGAGGGKGIVVLHSLRYLIGDQAFFELLRRQAYPQEPDLDDVNRCSQCRIATSEDFIALAKKVSGQPLDWFFDLYLRRPELPALVVHDAGDHLQVAWQVPEGMRFPMPLEFTRNGERERVAMPEGRAVIHKQPGDDIVLDPDFWVLRQARPNADQFGTLLKPDTGS